MAYKNATPHTYLDTQVDVTSLLELVGELQAQDPEVCMTDVVLRAAGVALGKVPEANVAHTGNGVLQDLPAADIALGAENSHSGINLTQKSAPRHGGYPGERHLTRQGKT